MTLPTIVVTDDDTVAREALVMLLSQATVKVLTVESGIRLLEMLQDFLPDVILLDVMMPGMDGYEVCRRLKADPRTRRIPVIMVTALSSREHMVRGFDAGADEFLTKPVSGVELRARVRSMLRIKHLFDELDQSLQLRDDLARMIVHDIRSPLTSIMGITELLLLDNLGPEDMLRDIASEAQRLNHLANDMLMLAKMEAGRMRVETARIDVAQVVSRAVHPYQAHHSRSLSVQLPPDGPHLLWLDETLVARVLDNLLSNAFKYSRTDVEVEVETIENGVRVRVRDTGPGIPEAFRDRVFDKFETVRLRQSGVSQTGLGLAFVRLAVVAHGGRIWIEDNLPQGAVFAFDLISMPMDPTRTEEVLSLAWP